MSDVRRIVAEKRAIIWPIAIALVANVILFAVVVYPLSKRVAGGEQEAAASAAALSEARRQHTDARATVDGKAQADAELQKFYTDVLPPDLSGARAMTYVRIDQLARTAGLRRRDRQYTEEAVRESDLARVTVRVALSGEYRDIRRFLHELETAEEFLVLENVQVTQPSGETRGLDVTVQIATYYRAGGHGND